MSMCAWSVPGQQVGCLFGDDALDQRDARVDHADGADDHRGNGLVAIGDRTDDGGIVGALPDVAMIRRDATGLETPTEPVTERSTGPPEHFDRVDGTCRAVLGCDHVTRVGHPQHDSPVDRSSGDRADDRRRDTGESCWG